MTISGINTSVTPWPSPSVGRPDTPVEPAVETQVTGAAQACTDCEASSAQPASAGSQAHDAHDKHDSSSSHAETSQDHSKQKNAQGQELSEEEIREVREMAARDREVRAHEMAHLAAAGQYAQGGIKLDMQRGPDGRSYAVGGEVGIDTSPVANDPEATLAKAQQIRAAAMAPAEPSSQDRRIAAEATQMAAQARAEIMSEKTGGEKASPTVAYGEDGKGQGEEKEKGQIIDQVV